MSSLVPMPLASSATVNKPLQRCHGLAFDEIDRRLEPRLPGAAVPTMGQPSPVNAVDVVAVPPVGQSLGCGSRTVAATAGQVHG